MLYRLVFYIFYIFFKLVYDVYESYFLEKVKFGNIFKYVVIIMDGNRRWVRKFEKFFWYGYLFGLKKFEEIFEWCRELNIRMFIVYVFLIENFKCLKEEVEVFMNFFEEKFKEFVQDERVYCYGIRVNVFGRKDMFFENVRKVVEEVERVMRKYFNYNFNIVFVYGGRSEIVDVVREIVRDVFEGKIKLEDIDEEVIKCYFYYFNMFDFDIVIRIGGEVRISNFFFYQIVYSEFFFVDVYFFEFRKIDFFRIICEFQKRQWCFGRQFLNFFVKVY